MTSGLLTPAQRTAAARVLESDSKRFTDLIKAAGLDPTKDLRGKSFRRIVIQPDEDVSGYDLSGCDLSGSVMRRVDLRKVNFDGANLTGTDLRSAQLPTGISSKIAVSTAIGGTAPNALKQGPNRLWPAHLFPTIDQILLQASTLNAVTDQAMSCFDPGEDVLAEHLFRICVDWSSQINGITDTFTLTMLKNVGVAIMNQGKPQIAVMVFEDVISTQQRVFGPNHGDTLITKHSLAVATLNKGQPWKAEALFQDLVQLLEQELVEDQFAIMKAKYGVAEALLRQGRTGSATQLLQTLLTGFGTTVRETNFVAVGARLALATAFLLDGATSEASDLLQNWSEEGPSSDAITVGQTFLVRAMIADYQAMPFKAEQLLQRMDDKTSHLYSDHYLRRELACYRATRTPGKSGGTTLWMITDYEDPSEINT